jgi:hypothetical protein
MKTWFPFSDYDFYSFLASGILLLFAIDYWLSGGEWAIYKNWTLQQNVLVLILAYITGQIITIPSSILYDTILINKVLGHPIEVEPFEGNLSYIKRFVGIIIGKDFGKLPESIKTNVINRAIADTTLKNKTLLLDKKNIFDIAYTAARKRPEDDERINNYRNQYGFSRNISLTSFITTGFMYYSSDIHATNLAILFGFLGFGMLLRFLTLYAAFSAEVLRSYAFEEKTFSVDVLSHK